MEQKYNLPFLTSNNQSQNYLERKIMLRYFCIKKSVHIHLTCDLLQKRVRNLLLASIFPKIWQEVNGKSWYQLHLLRS